MTGHTSLTQIVQGEDGSDETAQVDDQRLIVGLHPESRPLDLGLSRVTIEVGQEVEDVLQVVHDLMVDGEFTLADEGEVIPDFDQSRMEPLERGDLGRDPVGQAAKLVGRLDVTQEVLDTDLFGFFSFDRGWDMGERELSRRAILSSEGGVVVDQRRHKRVRSRATGGGLTSLISSTAK